MNELSGREGKEGLVKGTEGHRDQIMMMNGEGLEDAEQTGGDQWVER